MIAACPQCQTRFRLAREKLGPQAERAFNEVSDEAIAIAKELKQRFVHLRDQLKKN